MDYHQNARLTIHSREQMCRQVVVDGLTLKLAAASFNVSQKTASKWVRRYREAGVAGLCDHSSRPRRLRAPRRFVHCWRLLAAAAWREPSVPPMSW